MSVLKMLPICGKNFLTFSINYILPARYKFVLKLAIFPANNKVVISHIFSRISIKTLPLTNISTFLYKNDLTAYFYFDNLCDSYKIYSVTVSESDFFLMIRQVFKTFTAWFKKLLPKNFLSK